MNTTESSLTDACASSYREKGLSGLALRTNFVHNPSYHELGETNKFELDWITVRANEIPDSLFELAIPASAEMIDRDMGDMRVRDPAEVEKHLNTALETIELASLPFYRRWGFLAATCVLIAASVVLIARMVLRKGTSGPRP